MGVKSYLGEEKRESLLGEVAGVYRGPKGGGEPCVL